MKEESLSIKELKQKIKMLTIIIIILFILQSIFFYRVIYDLYCMTHNVIEFMYSLLFNFMMSYYFILYIFIVIRPCIKEKEMLEQECNSNK